MMSLQNPDRLIPALKNPMLDDYYHSAELKAEVVAIAEEVKRRYLVKLAPHTDTGRLASTARVTSHRSTVHPDRRWEAEFSVGGGRADYADDLEREYGLLASVLNEMGFFQGDGGGSGPTGRVPVEKREPKTEEMVTVYHRTTKDSATSILADGFKSRRGGFVYFSTERDHDMYSGYGDHELSVQVPRSALSEDRVDKGSAVKVRRADLAGRDISYEVRRTVDERQAAFEAGDDS